jgi:glycosyltransferase involved in cell wall biosynthesis
MNASKQITICLIAPKAYPLFDQNTKDVIGGIEVDLYLLAQELSKDNNYQVRFITADYGQNLIEIIHKIKVIKSFSFSKNIILRIIHLWKALKKSDSEIYFQEGASLGTFFVGLFCYVHNKIFIYRTAHKNHCDGTYTKQHPFWGRMITWILHKSGWIFVQNESDRLDIKRTLNITSSVIRNAHHIPDKNKEKKDYILWAGRSANFKNPKLFFTLSELFPNENFVMICQQATEDHNYDSLLQLAKNLKNLTFHQQILFDEIDNYFSEAKVYVSTSDSEGFANTFIQACKCATPILSLKVNPDDFLNRYQCGLCAEGDWDRFVEQLKQLLDPETAKKYGENGRKYAQEHHDIRKIVEQYKVIFQKLVNEKKKK